MVIEAVSLKVTSQTLVLLLIEVKASEKATAQVTALLNLLIVVQPQNGVHPPAILSDLSKTTTAQEFHIISVLPLTNKWTANSQRLSVGITNFLISTSPGLEKDPVIWFLAFFTQPRTGLLTSHSEYELPL